MRKVLLIATVILLGVFCVFWLQAAPNEKLHAGDTLPPMVLKSVVGADVSIPSPTTRLTHLQFRRFGGCPICNLHMHEIIDRYEDIASVGIKEVVVFHSPESSLVPYQGNFPFDVIADPEKKLYEQFGVDSSVFALIDPRVFPALVRATLSKDKPTGDTASDPWTRPAEFLIDNFGRVVASHYGRHANDQWSVDELIEKARR